MQQHLYKHLYSKGHNGFLRNVSVSLMEKTDNFQSKKRTLKRTLKTLAPLEINVEGAV